MSALSDLLAEVPEVLVKELTSLIHIIMLSNSPRDAINKAQRVLLTDASDAAADEALRALLKKK